MVRSLSSPKINLKLSGSLQNTLTDTTQSSTVTQPNWNYSKSLTSGVSANQGNRAWQSVNQSIANGAQVTSFGTGNGLGRDCSDCNC
jgi:hypothetical protein